MQNVEKHQRLTVHANLTLTAQQNADKTTIFNIKKNAPSWLK